MLIGLSVLAFGTLLWMFARRLAYPYDLEWMEGTMLLHAHRLREGQPLYAPPSLAFVAFAYPPLQPALVALASTLFGLDYATGRALSILAYFMAVGAKAAAETAMPPRARGRGTATSRRNP